MTNDSSNRASSIIAFEGVDYMVEAESLRDALTGKVIDGVYACYVGRPWESALKPKTQNRPVFFLGAADANAALAATMKMVRDGAMEIYDPSLDPELAG